MLLLPLLLMLHHWTTLVHGQVPVSDFYPFGNSSGDLTLPPVDDESIEIPINFEFPFFDSTYREVHVSTNGQINFGAGDSDYIPRPFPLNDSRSIACYWVDSDPSRGGDVYYRETELPSLLDRITADIRSRFLEYQSFTSRWALVVTFDNVPAFNCLQNRSSELFDCVVTCDETLTYQTVLTSNGVQSFVIFNYNSLMYPVRNGTCYDYAQAGFNAGDGKRFYLMPSSNTPDVAQVALTSSNVGVPGKWMFTVDGSEIAEGCNDRGLLEIYPRKVLYFGRQDITIGGPCFSGSQQTVTVTVGNVQVVCQVSLAQQLICTTPRLTKLGNNDVTLIHNGITYRSFVVAVDIDDRIVGDGRIEARETSNSNAAFTLSWTPSHNCGANDRIDFKGFQVDYIYDNAGNIVSEESSVLNYRDNPNNGNIVIQPINRAGSFMRSISLAGYCSGNSVNGSPIPIARVSYIASASTSATHCVNWHGKQPPAARMSDIVEEVSEGNPCAPGVTSDFPQTTGNFALDETCNPSNPDLCTFYHRNAKACYRSITNVNQRVTQCCYDSNALLILGSPGGGNLAFADPNLSPTDHAWQDVIPYMTCCKFNLNDFCHKFHDKRPSIDSRLFRPPGNGNGGGDPHFSTLDGTSYTFNPIGEFTYLIAGNDVIQTRITQYEDQSGNKKEACYFSAFVIQSGQSMRIQVELSSVKLFIFRVNGQTVSMEYGRWSFGDVSLDYRNNATVVVQTASAIGVEIQIIGGVLNAIVSLPTSLKGRVSGLLGNWDDNADNDFQLPDGTFIPINSPPAEIHNRFGMAWSTTSATSLFTYPNGLEWSDYQNRIFLPTFTVPLDNPACHGDKECNFDATVTGDINVGLSNVAVKERVAEIDEFNEEMATFCPASVGVANGQVTVEVTSVSHVSYSVKCDSGFTLQGQEKVTCVNGQYDAIGVCASAYKTPPVTSAMMMIVLAAGVLRHLMETS